MLECIAVVVRNSGEQKRDSPYQQLDATGLRDTNLGALFNPSTAQSNYCKGSFFITLIFLQFDFRAKGAIVDGIFGIREMPVRQTRYQQKKTIDSGSFFS